MLEAYQGLFDAYLRVCKNIYDTQKPYDNLEECVGLCEHFTWKLLGMLELLHDIGCITLERKLIEKERVFETFNSVELFGAYKDEGPIMVFERSTMPEDPNEF